MGGLRRLRAAGHGRVGCFSVRSGSSQGAVAARVAGGAVRQSAAEEAAMSSRGISYLLDTFVGSGKERVARNPFWHAEQLGARAISTRVCLESRCRSGLSSRKITRPQRVPHGGHSQGRPLGLHRFSPRGCRDAQRGVASEPAASRTLETAAGHVGNLRLPRSCDAPAPAKMQSAPPGATTGVEASRSWSDAFPTASD